MGPKCQQKSTHEVVVVTDLPPSVNNLYQRTRKGGVALTSTAKKFQEGVKAQVADYINDLSDFPTGPEDVYSVNVALYFEALENKGWYQLDKSGNRKAQFRYKRLDVDNRVKFLQDCVVKLLGIVDDCQVFFGSQEKYEDPKDPRAVVTVCCLPGPEPYLYGGE